MPGLRIEQNSKKVVLVVCDRASSAEATMIADEIAKKTASKGKRKVLIYVISPLGRPEYFEAIRRVIQENIGLSMSIRYSGSKPEDILELIERLGNPDVVVVGSCRNFIQALDNTGYENIVVICPGKSDTL